jgi:4-hydroxythreonine-4-phosphate dehydrogenase
MSDSQNNSPNNTNASDGNAGGDRRRRSRGGRNRNRNRKPKGEGDNKPEGGDEKKSAEKPKEGQNKEGGDRNNDNRNKGGRNRNRNRNNKPSKNVKAAEVSEEVQEQMEFQSDLYNLDFDSEDQVWEGEDVLKKPVLGITCGDLNGIGMEVIIKALEDERVAELCTPVVFASSKLASYHRNAIDKRGFNFNIVDSVEEIKEGKNNLVSVWEDNVELQLGTPTDVSGAYALKSIDAAIAAAKDGKIDAIVTAPINKHNIAEAVPGFSGHTGYLADAFGDEVLMILTAAHLKVATVTGHIPIREVADALNAEKIEKSLELLVASLKRDFGKVKPSIAVLGLNPHAGEMGTIGKEEQEIIAPAIASAQKLDAIIKGPFPADGFFGQGYEQKFDAVLGMYHDQVLVPFKSIAMGAGTNFTAGLRTIRTSPDHGTAMHLAGKGTAEHGSFLWAIFTAIDTVQARMSYDEMTANPLKKQKEKN